MLNAGDRRDRGRALLQAQGRRLRGHHPRRGQERDRAQDRAGRLDADDAARPQPLHAGRHARAASRATSARSARRKLARDLEDEALRRSGCSASTSTRCPYGTVGGQTAIGAGAAARLYFNKRVQDLTLREAAMLAGMPQAPSTTRRWSTRAGPRQRRNEVLGKMAELGLHLPRDGAEGDEEGPRAAHGRATSSKARERYVLDYVKSELIKEYGARERRSAAASRSTRRSTSRSRRRRAPRSPTSSPASGPSSAIVTIDPKNGDIVAMASSQALRQVEVQPRRPGPPPARLVVQDHGAADRAARGREPELDAATSRARRWSSTTRRAARPATRGRSRPTAARARQHEPRPRDAAPPTTPSTRS